LEVLVISANIGAKQFVKKLRIIRPYTLGEEIGNAVSHGIMALIALGGIAPTAIHVYLRQGVLATVGASVFMCSLFLMFLSSTLYHSMTGGTRQKQIMQILDHILIYVAIAGTYTPIALSVIGGWPGIAITGLQWAMVVFGIFYKSLAKHTIPRVSLTIYLVMGWSAVIVAPLFVRNASLGMLLLIIGGGVFYSLGAYFYAKKEKLYFHMIWHFFVSLGAVSHYIGILLFLR